MSIVGELIKKETSIDLRIIPETDVYRKLEWLKNGYIDMFYYGANNPVHIQGDKLDEVGYYRGPFQMRLVGSSHFGALAPVVRGDSPIKTIYDITAKTRWSTPSGYLGPYEYGILSWLKLINDALPKKTTGAESELKGITHHHFEASFKAMMDGEADITFADAVTPWVRKASQTSPGIRFLDMSVDEDPDGAERFLKHVPF